jgi:hypothetical protein
VVLVLLCKGAMISGRLRTTDFSTAFCGTWFISTNTKAYSHAVAHAFSHWPPRPPYYMEIHFILTWLIAQEYFIGFLGYLGIDLFRPLTCGL